MAQVISLKLNKRNCSIRIRLTPCGNNFQKIEWKIKRDRHIFRPSAAIYGQFSSFVTAVYCLYSENTDQHTSSRQSLHQYQHIWHRESPCEHDTIIAKVCWEEEGRYDEIWLLRRCIDGKAPTPDQPDPIAIRIYYAGKTFRYTVDARDLCYAIAKAATSALKKYGFRGYFSSSGSDVCFGDAINIEQLLFLKAYALDALDVRELKTIWKKPKSWMRAEGTSFDDEIKLLLFDM